ncbi:MAG: signal transduction protein [Hyphomonas sp. TMED17]|nr:MAG: signal transduction protein [Hyphomonas sp. TMED17]
MKIKDRPELKSKPAPLTTRPDELVVNAVKQMAEKNFGSIVVVNDDNTIAGIVTERDIFRRVVAELRDPATTRVSEVMTRDVRTANEEDNLLDWLRIMSNERFRRLPVVDDDGRLKSVMSQGDFVSYTWPQLFQQAATLVKSTIGAGPQIFLIIGGILVYTTLLVFVLASTLSA